LLSFLSSQCSRHCDQELVEGDWAWTGPTFGFRPAQFSPIRLSQRESLYLREVIGMMGDMWVDIIPITSPSSRTCHLIVSEKNLREVIGMMGER
jgi:hypothetical protein